MNIILSIGHLYDKEKSTSTSIGSEGGKNAKTSAGIEPLTILADSLTRTHHNWTATCQDLWKVDPRRRKAVAKKNSN